jgi:RecB family exonuclease
MIITPSQMETWDDCHLRWWHSRQPRPPGSSTRQPTFAMRQGTAVHDSWEEFLHAPVEKRSLELLSVNVDLSWDAQRAEADAFGWDVTEKSWIKARDVSQRMAGHYWDEFGQDVELANVETEVTLSLDLNEDVTLQARLDAVDMIHGVDHELKTTGTAPQLESYLYFRPQMRIQALLLAQKIKQLPKVAVTVLWPTGAIRGYTTVTMSHMERTRREVLAMAEGIQQERFEPTEGWHCDRCSFHDICLDRILRGG